MITLLSQQGVDDDVFFQLHDDYLHSLMDMFISGERACEELDDIQINIKFGMIHSKNVDIVSDPFIRSLLLARYENKF